MDGHKGIHANGKIDNWTFGRATSAKIQIYPFMHNLCTIVNIVSFHVHTLLASCLVARPDKVLSWRTIEWVANPLGPGQTSAIQIKTRSA